MATYKATADKFIPIATGGSSLPLVSDYTIWMTEGLQQVINAVPTDMLWMFETSSDFADDESAVEGVSVGTNKILYVQRESDTNLIDAIAGVDTFSQTSSTWEMDKTWYNVSQTGTSGDGVGALFTVVANSSGDTHVTKTASGGGYKTNNTITLTDPGNTSATITLTITATTEALTNDDKMLVECREVPASLRGRVTPGSGYMEEATETDPIWYKLGGKVYIFPVSNSRNSKVYWVQNPPTSLSGGDDYLAGTSGIPIEVDPTVMEYIIYKALCEQSTSVITNQRDSIKDLHTIKDEIDDAFALGVTAIGKITSGSYDLTKVNDALLKAEELFADYTAFEEITTVSDATADTTDFSAVGWMEEEELENVQSILAMINTELARAQAETSKLDYNSKAAAGEAQSHFSEIQSRLGVIQSELAEYNANTAVRSAVFQELMATSQKHLSAFQQSLGLLVKGYMPETADDMKRPPTYSGLAQ